MAERKINLRPASDADEEFLYELYCSTRQDEVAQFGWTTEQADAFLRMQFTARQAAYKIQFPSAVHDVIVFGGRPAGRLIIDRPGDKILLTDIAVLSEFQGNGVAGHIIRQLQKESATSGLPIILHVDKTNFRGFEFYLKRGFEITCETQLMWEMEWKGEPAG